MNEARELILKNVMKALVSDIVLEIRLLPKEKQSKLVVQGLAEFISSFSVSLQAAFFDVPDDCRHEFLEDIVIPLIKRSEVIEEEFKFELPAQVFKDRSDHD